MGKIFAADLVLNCKSGHAVCREIIGARVQPTVALFILTPCLAGLISGELNNSEVDDVLKELCRSQVPTLEARALMVLRTAFRHKLWVYDVVPSFGGLHHMEAAVASAPVLCPWEVVL